jgi:hypothetical protein
MTLGGVLFAFALVACGGAAGPYGMGSGAAVHSDTAFAAQAPRRALFPATRSGVHLDLVFNFYVRDVQKETGVVDVVWGASAPVPKAVFNQSYTTFQRDDSYGPHPTHSLAWWKAHHPTWVEYRCDRNVAFAFGDPNVPLDIANPNVLAYQRAYAVDPALRAGYDGMAFDNVDIGDDDQRCGHYASSGAWVQQYTGKWVDRAYERDVVAWARDTYAYVHAFSPRATMAMNFSYNYSFSLAENLAVTKNADMILNESGFTNWGGKPNITTPAQWRAIVAQIDALQANGTCYMENGEEPGLSANIPQSERLWVVANYLLTRDDCTYVWISGYTASGGQDYGRMLLYPEYFLAIGTPSGSRTAVRGAWERGYSGGLALVNPTNASVTVPLSASYVDENGIAYAKAIVLAPTSGQILLRRAH